jgi:hypothetical protein
MEESKMDILLILSYILISIASIIIGILIYTALKGLYYIFKWRNLK